MKIRKLRYKRKRIYSPWKKKLLLFLLGALLAGSTHLPRRISKFWASLPDAFKKIDKKYLSQLIQEFYRDRLVDMVDVSDEETKMVITEKGKLHAIQFKIEDMQIKTPKHWDGKWRIVVFDIPEKMRNARNALRRKLKELGFYELQKSVMICPFECRDEVDFIVEFFRVRPHVRYGHFSNVTNEAELLKHFDLK